MLVLCLLSPPPTTSAQEDDIGAVSVSRLDEWHKSGRLELGFEVPDIRNPRFPELPWSREKVDPLDPRQLNPHYVRGTVAPTEQIDIKPHGGTGCFVVPANGGNAVYRFHAAYSTRPDSPPGWLPLNERFTYRLSGYVMARGVPLEGLQKTVPELLAVAVDAAGKPLGHSVLSPRAIELKDGDWVRLETILDDKLTRPAAGLWIFVRSRGHALKGLVAFDDILIERLPRTQLVASQPDLLFVQQTRPGTHHLRVHFQGLEADSYESRLQLISPDGRVIPHRHAVRRRSQTEDEVAALLNRPRAPRSSYQDHVDWVLPFESEKLPFGLYTVVHGLYLDGRLLQQQRRKVAYLRRFSQPPGGGLSFGVAVAVPEGDDPVLNSLLDKLGVRWVKLGIWQADTTEQLERAEVLDRLLDQLGGNGIQAVGVLDEVPRVILDRLKAAKPGTGAVRPQEGWLGTVFASDPVYWQDLFQATATRFGNRLNWWQVGPDNDPTWHGAHLQTALANLRRQLNRVELQKNLVVPLDVIWADPDNLKAGIDTLSLSVGGELLPHQLEDMAGTLQGVAGGNWINLRLADRRVYGQDKQIMDMVKRMVYTVKGGWDTVFLGPLADDGTGLVMSDRSPNTTYLAARTLVNELSGFRMLRHVQFPGGVEGFFFADAEDNAKLVAWAEEPTDFEIYLGSDIQVTDLAGNVSRWVHGPKQTSWPVGRWPQVFGNINSNLLRTRLSFMVDPPSLMLTSMSQRVKLKMTNHFPQPIDGTIKLTFPDNWEVDRQLFRFSLSGNTDWEAPFRIYLPRTAEAGRIDVTAKVKVNVTKRIGETKQDFDLRFSQPVDVRARDFEVDVRLEQSPDDKRLYFFEVEVRNVSDKYLNLTCLMSPPGMMPDEKPLPLLAPGGRTYRTFRLRTNDRLDKSRIRFLVRDRRGEHFVNRYVILGSSGFYEL